MKPFPLLPAALAGVALIAASAAQADERRYSVSNFDRIRVQGPFEVRLVAGKAPSGVAVADVRTLDQLALDVEGTTLIVRLNGQGWGETPRSARTTAPVITLTTPMLRSALVNAGGRLRVTTMKAQRVDLTVNGSGSIDARGIDTDQLVATVIGTGDIGVAGRASRAQLLDNGSGRITGTDLQVNDLTVRLDGPGEIRAAARYTAKVTTTGLGKVTVDGNPSCTVTAIAGGPVVCGKD